MKWKLLTLLLTAGLLLNACAGTVSSVDAICELEKPTFTKAELQGLSQQTLSELDVYFEKLQRGCTSRHSLP